MAKDAQGRAHPSIRHEIDIRTAGGQRLEAAKCDLEGPSGRQRAGAILQNSNRTLLLLTRLSRPVQCETLPSEVCVTKRPANAASSVEPVPKPDET